MMDKNYIILQGWQVKRLRLAGDKLLIYSAIYGFTQDRRTAYKGGYPYLMEWTGKSRDTIRRHLASLVADGLILREEEEVRGVVYVNYRTVIPPPNTDGLQNAGRDCNDATTPSQNATPMPQDAMPTQSQNATQENKNRELNDKESKELSIDLSNRSVEFCEAWAVLVQQPKWRKKTPAALRMSLKKLSRFPDAFAVKLMEDAVENDWQGVVFNDTEERYKKWENENSRRNNDRVQGPTFGAGADDTTIF